ncbi:MAG: hypothetical protein CSA18_01765 [Deltaproteobacteria bacterium]|nr:MAG: hypothetical protein CSA18_01765 [Deltaproteobacteria bacterium]
MKFIKNKYILILLLVTFTAGLLSGFFWGSKKNINQAKKEAPYKERNLDYINVDKNDKKIIPIPEYILKSLKLSGFSGSIDEKQWKQFLEKTKVQGIKNLEKELKQPVAVLLARIPGIRITPSLMKLIGDDINKIDKDGNIPLFYAAEYGDINTLKSFYEAGGDLYFTKTDENGKNIDILNFASKNKRVDSIKIIDFLLKNGFSFENGEQYFSDAVRNPYFNAKYLEYIVNNIDLDFNNVSTPLFQDGLTANMSREMIDIFLKKESIIEKSRFGSLPVLAAASVNKNVTVGIFKQMVDKGADINASYEGITPLHYAILFGRADLVKFLIKNGADPHLKGESGTAPVEMLGLIEKGAIQTPGKKSDYDKIHEIIADFKK